MRPRDTGLGRLVGALAMMLACVMTAPRVEAQFIQQAKLVGAAAVLPPEYQGASVAVSANGNTAILGAPWDYGGSPGAACVYTHSGGVWSQQDTYLVGTGALGWANQGWAVALSGDGNTAIVGGYTDDGGDGAAWVYTLSGGVWSQQGAKLLATDGGGLQGSSVALSADGNTAIVGGPDDNLSAGAAWVYTRNGSVWSQQGAKLVGTGAVNAARQGGSVALSADGNSAIVGGYTDNDSAGAAWVFTRSGGVWSQQGAKLVGTGALGPSGQGISVAMSGDGNTAIVGGYADNTNAGAAWVYTRSGGVWSQQGAKLVGTGAVDAAQQGNSVSVSADGNTAIVGGYTDNANVGAAWVYTRSGGVWSQQGAKLVGTGAAGTAQQGISVALSADGSTAVVGGPSDNGNTGAAWVFVNSAALGVPGDAPRSFALEGVYPNPASSHDLMVRFVLPVRAAAWLELFDVAGRSVVARDVGMLGAGAHALNLFEHARIRPGLYFVRLRQGANGQVRRVTVLE